MYRIGMTQWVFGNEPLEESCKRLHACGYQEIEFAAEPDTLDAEECKKWMEQYHLTCHSLCGIYTEERDLTAEGEGAEKAVCYLKKSLDFAHRVGAKLVIVVPSPVGRTEKPEGRSMNQLLECAAKNIRKAAEYAEQYQIHLAIEPINRYETYLVQTVHQAYELAKQINHPLVGVMADLFHMNIEEDSFVDAIYEAADRLIHVHLADSNRGPIGGAHTNLQEILRALHRISYQGSLTMEFMYNLANPYLANQMDTQTEQMTQNVKKAIEYVRTIENMLEA
jgi:sugar phosphate isomerase/epimerase